jgi:SAM-dependent MidA family methyltransferase
MPSPQTPEDGLGRRIHEKIQDSGPISFAEYMRLCLYDSEFGYYMRTPESRRPDYYTSVDMSPVFARLIARQLYEMWQVLDRPREFSIVECGAAGGALASGILNVSQKELPDFYGSLRYHAVEISPLRRELAAQLLSTHISAGHASVHAEMPEALPQGCVLANELVDALPVHRVVFQGGTLHEILVDSSDGEFFDKLTPASPRICEFFGRQQIVLHEGQQAEVGLDACEWAERVGRLIERGFVLIIDYGRESRELYDEHHMRGTLLAYSGHRTSEDFYRAPGEQDLTAHANFTALDLWGRISGLIRTGLTSQTNFLLSLARQNNFADLEIKSAGGVENLRARLQFKSLIYPEGMGETFQVMVQHKGVPAPLLTGLAAL